jgi:DNA-binding GntR family transcriptional regulator
LNSRLRELIDSAGTTVGTKFLTEWQIGERFAVSGATANKALSILVSEDPDYWAELLRL